MITKKKRWKIVKKDQLGAADFLLFDFGGEN
jgi:hypothetical protein